MAVQSVSIVSGAGLIRKSILAVLIGLMGGSSAVLAQQAADAGAAANPPAAVAQTSDAVPEAAAAASADASAGAQATDAKPDPPMDAATLKAVNKIKGKSKKKKEKLPKQTPLNIVQGTLTVDGWTGKARMNYDIANLKYVYLWAPGVGTVVVSNGWFPLSKIELNAFSGNTLTVDANGHTLQVYSEKRLLGKKPASAFVYIDTVYQFPSAYPVMGYGNTVQAPYAWPGAKNVQVAKAGIVAAPPLPVNLRPTMASPGCVPAGAKTPGTPCPVVPVAPVTPAAPVAPAAAAVATTSEAKTP